MNSENQKAKLTKQKKGIIIAFSAMIGLVLLAYVIVPGISKLAEYLASVGDDGAKSDYMDDIKSFNFYPADYGENIFEDEEYMSLNRYISYTKGADTYVVTDGSYAQYDQNLEFFAKYFDDVINGKYETYDKYFTKEYFKENTNKSRFTPQKLYDINVKFKSSVSVDGATAYVYYVSYKIFKNNGTFRNDIESDASRLLVYELYVDENNETLINYIGRNIPTYE